MLRRHGDGKIMSEICFFFSRQYFFFPVEIHMGVNGRLLGAFLCFGV